MKLIATKYKQGVGLFGFEDNRLVEANIYKDDQEVCIGDIYLGKIDKVLSNMNAYFVKIGGKEDIFLPFSETKASYKCGENVLIQIKKEASKGKQPSGTTKLSISGLYCVVNYEPYSMEISSKLDKEQRIYWKEALKNMLSSEEISLEDKEILLKYCLIIRTNVVEANHPQEVLKEWIILAKKLDFVVTKGVHQTAFSKLYSESKLYLSKVKNLSQSLLEEIVTDERTIYDGLIELFQDNLEMKEKIRFYQDDFSLTKLYSIESKLAEALEKKVWLRCGGFLMIEPTEALTVIDVNSGKYEKKGDANLYYKKVNEEAAIEIARQLRLRNISGIVIVDFINMKLEKDKNELLELLSKLVSKDSIKTSVLGMTNLGLVEITRAKKEKPLWEQVL